MLTLRNCTNDKHNAWGDLEAEIQKELEALDAHDNSYASGNFQTEIVEEKEKVNIVDRVADDFESLMQRFHLQNEKLLHFEQSVFSSGRSPNALLEDTTAETFPGEDSDYAHSYSSHSSFLTVQHLIRPLYCLDQEDTLCFNGDSVENLYPGMKHKDSSKNPEEEHEIGFTKEVQSIKEIKKKKCLSIHAAKRTRKGQRIKILENVKDICLHSLQILNHKQSSLNEVKLKDSNAESQKSAFLSDIAPISHWNKDKISVSMRWETGASSINSCRASSLITRANHALTQTPSIHSIQSNTGRPLLLVSLDLIKWEQIVVNSITYDMTRTRMLNQLDVRAHIGTHIDKYFRGSPNSVTDGRVLYAAPSLLLRLKKGVVKFLDRLSLIPQLNKVGVKFLDETGPCTSCFFPQFSLICSHQLPPAHASIKDERRLFLATNYRQLVEKEKYLVQECNTDSKAQVCVLEQAHARDDDDDYETAVLEKRKKLQPEISAHLKEIVKLQAMVKGFLARRHHRARLDTEKRKLSFFVSKIQACWRGCIVRRACESKRRKNMDLSEDECLQPAFQLDWVKLDTPAYLRKIVILQALARGFLARKYHRTILLHEEQRMYYLASKVKALWKGWRVRNSDVLKQLHARRMRQETALVKFQALWRGFSTRRRFQMAIEGSKYNDYDDFEYAVVDENDYLPEERCLEELATLCRERSAHHFQSNLISDTFQGATEDGVQICTHHFQTNLMSDTFQETIEDGVQSELNKQSREVGKKTTHSGEQLEPTKAKVQKDETSAVLDLSSSAINLADSDNPTNGHLEGVFKAEQLDMCHHKTAGKKHHQPIDETKDALADIARDWGFKEEKTAMQFIRALNNTRRRAEGPKAPKPDSETRLRAFMARTGRQKKGLSK